MKEGARQSCCCQRSCSCQCPRLWEEIFPMLHVRTGFWCRKGLTNALEFTQATFCTIDEPQGSMSALVIGYTVKRLL